jgi:hypothetical protein
VSSQIVLLVIELKVGSHKAREPKEGQKVKSPESTVVTPHKKGAT